MKSNIFITLSIILAILLTACNTLPPDISSSVDNKVINNTESVKEPLITDEISIVEKTTSSQQSHSSTTTTSETELEPQKTLPQQPTSSKPAPPTSSNNSTDETLSSNNKNQIYHPISGLPFKQLADHETGISWDGVSPIIYTYPDGSTGTEKREGATYEGAPGIITTVVTVDYGKEMTPSQKPLTCTECGKELGDGTNGTCLMYWTGGDHECANCGEIIPEYTCHTCK